MTIFHAIKRKTHPDKRLAVNLLRWIISILGSLSKYVEISASVWVRQFSQKYLFSPLRCSTVANCDKAQERLWLFWPFFGVGEKVWAFFASYTFGSFWTGTLMSWKCSKRFFASSHVMHLVWCRSRPWNKSSNGLQHWLFSSEDDFLAGKFSTSVFLLHSFAASSTLFLISFSASCRFTSKLHRNSWASCWRLPSNNGFCFLVKRNVRQTQARNTSYWLPWEFGCISTNFITWLICPVS